MEENYHDEIMHVIQEEMSYRRRLMYDPTLTTNERYRRIDESLERQTSSIKRAYDGEIQRIQANTEFQISQLHVDLERVLQQKQHALDANIAQIEKNAQEKIDDLCIACK